MNPKDIKRAVLVEALVIRAATLGPKAKETFVCEGEVIHLIDALRKENEELRNSLKELKMSTKRIS